VVKLLVEWADAEADSKDSYGATPLSWAAGHGHEAVVKLLVERNDVEADSKDSYDETPLLGAAERGHKAVVQLLLERADVSADWEASNEQTPLSRWQRTGTRQWRCCRSRRTLSTRTPRPRESS
jgi:ankyrin repeat protein